MGHGTFAGRTDLLRIFPQRTGGIDRLARLPGGPALFEHRGIHFEINVAVFRINRDDVTILDQGDRTTYRRFRPHMADAEPARRARETSIGDERHLVAHALPVKGRRGGEHFAHAGPALRAFISDDENLALLVIALLDRLEGFFLAVEAARRTTELQMVLLHARYLHNGAIRRKRALQTDNAACRRDRIAHGAHDLLLRVELHILQIVGNRLARNRQAVAMNEAAIKQRLQHERHTANFEEILRDIVTAG